MLPVLAQRGWLEHEAGRLTKRVTVADVGRLHLYAVSRTMVEDDPDHEGDHWSSSGPEWPSSLTGRKTAPVTAWLSGSGWLSCERMPR